jgi:UDP-N-acetylglucosamine 2-epimerase (non-hydrolysing)
MIEFEKVLQEEKPEMILVVGDVNSTIACSLTAKKMSIKVGHVEAGLRSFDMKMPEEINRILTDRISDYLFVTEKSGLINLRKEGINENQIFFVGHVMIDSLIYYLPKTERSSILSELKLQKQNYILVTLHRPSNVDVRDQLVRLFDLLNKLGEKRKIIFPMHPRTRKNLHNFGIDNNLSKNIIITEPIGYIDFLTLLKYAELVLTDSGGIQEETTYLGIQCITLRDTTERPITLEIGTNQLLGNNLNKAENTAFDIINGNKKIGSIPELWDGKSAERIVNILLNIASTT